ncbi:hypothetical protein QQF64_028088 [Cirrhinus molitorella]|uniref:Uncharacterized protein n=1 Tax=Cirrhinus molitorella TaxID=172907 RepID=A0ABR3N603_9TELE
MFQCRRYVSGAALLFTGPLQALHASRSLRNYRCLVYRRLTACKPALLRSGFHETRFGSPDLVARERMAALAWNAAAPRREYSDVRNGDRNVLKLGELESLLSVRSAPVAIQTRRSSTTPEKTQGERAANIQTVRQLN